MFNSEENIAKNTQNQFNIQIYGYEGPIDLLLELARKQKVDLSEISILELAEQYLLFIEKYRELHLEIAADYLVMAAWLTYLKSRLLLPTIEKNEEHTPEELEEAIKFQLQRLQAMQNISKKLYSLPLINRDIFYGGSVDGVNIQYDISYQSSLFDLLKSYVSILKKSENISTLTINPSDLFSVDEALQRLKQIFGSINQWTNFMNLIPEFGTNIILNKSSVTANFVASLELIKNGIIEVKQSETFGNIFVKSKN